MSAIHPPFPPARWLAALVCVLPVATALHAAAPKVNLNEAEFRDRVYACWTGKNIGGTLGMPFEGQQDLNHVTFYTNLKEGQAAPNDDIDLPLLWLKALEEHDGRVDARVLGEYWLKCIPVDWNEYGVGKANLKLGLLPPLCGEFNNARWKNSNGAIIRSELWGCLFPGCPELALRHAREDACVDHGAAEGTFALLFMTAIDSAAFVEPDRDKLLQIGLASIPPDCRIAKAVRAVLQARKDGKDWKAARQAVVEASMDTGWFQSPRYIGFVVLGWAYGELEREKGCTPRAIDGIIAGPNDFEGKRWHSAIDAPHPHWVQVKLIKTAKIGRVVIRFADPAGRPVDFKGLVLAAGGQEWKEVFAVKGYEDPRKFRRDIDPVEADTFRLVIEKSVNPVTLNAAQVSEIELYPPTR